MSIFAGLAIGSSVTKDGVTYKNDAINGYVVVISLAQSTASSATATIGDGVSTSYVIPHTLGLDVIAQVYRLSDGKEIEVDIDRTPVSITVTFSAAIGVASHRVVILKA